MPGLIIVKIFNNAERLNTLEEDAKDIIKFENSVGIMYKSSEF